MLNISHKYCIYYLSYSLVRYCPSFTLVMTPQACTKLKPNLWINTGYYYYYHYYYSSRELRVSGKKS